VKALFGVVGLLVVVAVIGLLARTQLAGSGASTAATQRSGADATRAISAPAGGPAGQTQQYKQSVDAALQQPARDVPDDAR
jgi:hypothetical protein